MPICPESLSRPRRKRRAGPMACISREVLLLHLWAKRKNCGMEGDKWALFSLWTLEDLVWGHSGPLRGDSDVGRELAIDTKSFPMVEAGND